MTATEQKLYVFTYLDAEWVPCGQLTLSEDGAKLSASSFAYGLRYLQRPGALEVDPVSLSLRDNGPGTRYGSIPAEQSPPVRRNSRCSARCLGPAGHRVPPESTRQQPARVKLSGSCGQPARRSDRYSVLPRFGRHAGLWNLGQS